METSIRRFVAVSGERYAVLVDGAGMPLYYPNLFATWRLRSRSLAANSVLNALSVIKVLYAWETEVGIDLESFFSRGEVLAEPQVRELCDFLQHTLPSHRRSLPVTRTHRRRRAVCSSNYHFRLTISANYLGFLARQLSPSGQSDSAAEAMVGMIKAGRPSKPSNSVLDRDERHLDDTVVDLVLAALKPNSENNPARDYAVQLRNMLMFMILHATGLRRGELLNLKINDIDFLQGTLRVVRRPDSTGDVRVHQPTAKTRQRTIPLLSELISHIHNYVLRYRSKLPAAKSHGYLFVTHKEGPTQGLPLSVSAFQKWMRTIASIFEDSGLHAHALRHHWNYLFSKMMDAERVSPQREERIRSYLMGWKETSGTAAVYNKRHIKKQAAEAVLELQNKYLKRARED